MAARRQTSTRAGHAEPAVLYAITECTLGFVAVARTARGLAAAFIDGDRDRLVLQLSERFPGSEETGEDALTRRVVAAIDESVDDLDIPLDPRGTEFQKAVWRALREIPAGSTLTYSELASRIGRPTSVRAVAAACGANPIAVIVPCHRVLGKDGSLTGYAWGLDTKRTLLDREKSRHG